ncbi:MAG: cyclodeaminase/cyclohydrolase family protein, partial [Phycisphaerae bacterium]
MHVLRKCAPVARYGVTESLCSRMRRQLGSQVDSDKAPSTPDDRANTNSVTTEPSTSGLGIVMHAPAHMTLRRESQPLNHLSRTTPRCLAQARQAQARQSRCASRLPALLLGATQADHPTHAEIDSLLQPQKAPKPQQRPRSCFASMAFPLVRSLAPALTPMPNAQCLLSFPMSFSSLSLSTFLAQTAAKQPTPGGGAVAGLTGALAAALAHMVVNYSL